MKAFLNKIRQFNEKVAESLTKKIPEDWRKASELTDEDILAAELLMTNAAPTMFDVAQAFGDYRVTIEGRFIASTPAAAVVDLLLHKNVPSYGNQSHSADIVPVLPPLPTGYISHNGGICPVPSQFLVNVLMRDGYDDECAKREAQFWFTGAEDWWQWEGSPSDNIVAYMVVEAP